MDKLIDMVNVNKVYGEKVKTQVLFDVNLSFLEGTFNSIIGASGSGKSTILNIMGTLDRPTSGTISIAGRETSKMKKNELAKLRNEYIGFVFQFHYLLPEFTALENILMPFWIKNKKTSKEIKERAKELLNLVNIYNVKDNLANNMSGGQQQRVAIARALINTPKIVLADEPTGNLDSESTKNIYDILRKINEEFRTTFIIITHDSRIAEKTDRIIEVKDGKIETDLVR